MIIRRPTFGVACAGALGLLLSTAGCSSTGVGNPGPVASLSLGIVADEVADDPNDEEREALPAAALEQAVLVIASVRWLPCDAMLEPLVQAGPFVVDLLGGDTTPELPEIELPAGGLCGFDAALGRARDPAELAGRSLFFSGARADGLEFILYADVRATLRLRLTPERAITGDESASRSLRLLWAMRPWRWTREAELGTAEPLAWRGGRRSIVIDPSRHPLLFAAVRARLASESGIFLDRDADGRLDGEERASALGTPSSEDSP